MNNNSSVYNQQVLLQQPENNNHSGSPYKIGKNLTKKKQNFIDNLNEIQNSRNGA